MRQRRAIVIVLVLGLSQMGTTCAEPADIHILGPGLQVDTFDFDVDFAISANMDPASVEVTLNHVSIRDRFTDGPVLFQANVAPGAPLRDLNFLKIKAERLDGSGPVTRLLPFLYFPPGKARATKIFFDSQRIRGPLGHSRLGDYVLDNGFARFAIQDVAQRELYSVGQYGGNLIDAERVDNPGVDNFLEIQPGVNIETVINAQTIEIVNDGRDGTAAIIRTCGPDDLLDFVNPSSQIVDLGLPFPALADDNDLDVEGCTTYSLAPNRDPADPQDFIRIETEIFNNDSSAPNPLPLVVGDWLNPSGELDTVARSVPLIPPGVFTPRANGVGPPVTTTFGSIGFLGFGNAEGVDYGITPVASPSPGSFALISGVLVMLHADNVVQVLLGGAPNFTVPFGGSRSFTRLFGVGDGSGTAARLQSRALGLSTGTLEGCISAGGVPIDGARVSVGAFLLSPAPATSPASAQLVQVLETKPGACPNYSGSVQVGSFRIAAAREGHLYENGLAVPTTAPVVIAAGATTTYDLDLPAAGTLRVNVTDAGGAPIPARVTVVGFDPSPEPLRPGPSLQGFGSATLGLFNDPDDSLPFGLTAVGHANAAGVAELVLEPGVDRYAVFVTRGTEYSAFQTATLVTIAGGSTTTINAQIARVLDTSGFVSSEFHVHGIRSADSRVSDTRRVASYASEGIENVVMTDHHVHTDLNPAIADAGMSAFLSATIGEEVTTFDYGHFNTYPATIDPNSPHATFADDGTLLSGGSTDWARAAPAGMDFPSFGAFNSTPAEILALARTGPLSTPGSTIQINHIDSHFAPLKIDTSLVPPADGLSNLERAQRRLPSTSAVPNLFQAFPALELWNGEGRGDQSQFLDERIGIWFNHLNQGLPTTFIADTDSHRFTSQRTAGARTWTASPTDDPAQIAPADVAGAVDAGRAVGGQGIYVQTRLIATDGSGDSASLSLDDDTQMTDAQGDVELEIHVQSPAWAQWDRIEIYRNAPTTATGSPYLFGATPDRVLEEGDCDATTTGDGDFDVDITSGIGGVTGADRLSATLIESFTGLTEETWFVVVVRGTDAQCEPMFPVYPADLAAGSNATIGDLVDGNLGEAGVMALGATNALTFVP